MRRLFKKPSRARDLVGLVALVSLPLTARAQSAELEGNTAPPADSATSEDAGQSSELPRESLRVLDATGYSLPARTVQLGLLYFGYGVTDWLSIGTQPGLWALGPALGGMLGNLSVRLSIPIGERVHVGLEVNPIWLNVGDATAFLMPATLGVSVDAGSWHSYSLAVRYVAAEGASGDDLDSQSVEGAAVTRLLQLVLQAQFEVSDSVAFYVRGTIQPWEQNLQGGGEARVDERTTLSFEGEASAVEDTTPWAALAGVHFNWGVAHLLLGMGYGTYFVPGIGLPVVDQILFPDLDFYVRF